MEELSVNIKICDRTYPMKVSTVEEARVRKAGGIINDQINTYSKEFGIHDKQDLLAMVAFDCLVATMDVDKKQDYKLEGITSQIKSLVQSVDQALS